MHDLGKSAIGAAGLDLPRVIGHRGAASLAPENTLAGLRRARALGCRWVEFDVRMTADNRLVLLHDDRLDRTTNGRGRARSLPLEAIRRCDAGSWFASSFAGEQVPTLEEAMAALSELGLGANLELKAERGKATEIGLAVAELTARLWPPHLPAPLISSFIPEAIRAARERVPNVAYGLLLRSAAGQRWRQAEALGCTTVNIDHRRLRPAIVSEIRSAGFAVLAYTVNDVMRARELFEWGVASVISDVPHLILAAISAEQMLLDAAPALVRPGLPS
ncbi:MAG TPA: glycerophosphodiester phosphodiesterase family protein [Stellaceae bacterium]